MENTDLFATEKISKILLRLAPPVMLAQLIQALYNIVDSLFVGRYSRLPKVFTSDTAVISIGSVGFRFVGISFLPMVTSLIFPVFFQAVGSAFKSSAFTVIRTVVLFVPLGFLFSRFGLNFFWMTFPVTEVLTSVVGALFYRRFLQKNVVTQSVSLDAERLRN